MSSIVPEWLDENFFLKVLRTSQNDLSLTILEVNVAAAGRSREHYASTIFKATVKYAGKYGSGQTAKLLIKLVVPKANAFSDESTYDTEWNMYTNTIPDMQRVLNQNGEKVQIAPRLLYSAKEPEPLFVFEDATTQGFGLSAGPLNYEGTQFVLTRLAKFHATSIYLDKDGKDVTYYRNGLFNLKSRDGINFMYHNINLFIDEVRSWDGYEIIVQKMEVIVEKFEELGEKVYETDKGHFSGLNVLNHGDFHFNNMLFKKDNEGKIADVLFLDFQMSKWGTPAIDLFYLLFMVASQETRDEHRHDIIIHYYREFTKALKDIGFMYKPPGMLDLNVELLKNGFLEVIIAVCFMPFFFINEHSDDLEIAFENGIEGIIFRRKLYKDPNYKLFISKLLSDFLYKGLLN